MEKIFDYFKENKIVVFVFIMLLIMVGGSFVFTYYYVKYEISSGNSNEVLEDDLFEDNEEEILKKVVVEIKGEVNSPGVYEVNSDKRINDVISLADGLTKNADVSVNNLSKKVEDEMIIIIYSKDEVKDFTKTKELEDLRMEECVKRCMSDKNACLNQNNIDSASNTSEDDKTSQNGSLVSINKATLDELLTIPGIGEAKAKAIIEYRKKQVFKDISDIKNVSGIGESIYAQIKDYITI